MSDTLVHARTPLHPTGAQAVRLGELWDTADLLHLTIRRWLRLVGRGRTVHVREALWQAADGRQPHAVPDRETIHIRFDALAQLGGLDDTEFPPYWRHRLPMSTIRAIVDIELRRLERYASRERAGYALPLTRLTRLPVDTCAQPLSACQVMLHDQILVADLWALPEAIGAAVTGRTRCSTRPHRSGHVSVVRSRANSWPSPWSLDWSVRVPRHYMPRATVDDVLGIDLGYRRLVTLADQTDWWVVERRGDAHLRLPATCPRDDETSLYADSCLRSELLDYHRKELEEAVSRALTYREVHIEAQDYGRIAERGAARWSAQAMQGLGAAYVPGWIEMLSTATGTRVEHVDPGKGSRVCAICRRRGERPSPYTHVVCPSCGLLDADVNGARLARLAWS